MHHQHDPSGQFPAGKHPFLKINGKPMGFLTQRGSYLPELDPTNFSLDGKLGRVLRSRAFAKFMSPYYDSQDVPGRTIVQIWNWLTWGLELNHWKNQTAADLDWLDERLSKLDFLTRRKINGEVRWVMEGY